MEPDSKRPKLSPIKVVIPDEDFSIVTVFPLALLSFLYPDYKIIFFNKEAEDAASQLHKHLQDPLTYIIRLNGNYLPHKNCYDFVIPDKTNHFKPGGKKKGKKAELTQRYFNDSKRCKTVPLATTGLMYKMYGKLILSKITGYELGDPNIDWLMNRTYFDYIEIIDAYSRNFSLIKMNNKLKTQKPRFSNELQTLPCLIKYYNVRWEEMEGLNKEEIVNLRIARLNTIVEIIKNGFINYVKFFAFSFIQGKQFVYQSCEHSLKNTYRTVLLEKFVPWKEHVYNWEKDNNKFGYFLYIIYSDTTNMWKISCIPENPGSFSSRKPLPSKWLGLKDEDLVKASGIEDAMFVHASGFIGGAKTQEGCVKMAEAAYL